MSDKKKLPNVRSKHQHAGWLIAGEGVLQFEEFGDVEYERVFSVPQGIDTDKVKAIMDNGVLSLHLPKSETVKPRQITVQAG
jgi:HSP20 family protein